MGMWKVRSLETRQAAMDFTSSGQGRPIKTQLVFDGTVVANAIELSEWSEEPVQLEVCAQCGFERCAPGGWAALRRLGNALLILPAFEAVAENPDEYGPPAWMAGRGPALMAEDLIGALQAAVPELPKIETLRKATGADAARSIQLSAPWKVLGQLPENPALRSAHVVAVSHGTLAAVVRELDRLLAVVLAQPEIRLREPDRDSSRVTLFLDLPGFPEWSPLVMNQENELQLLWGPYAVDGPASLAPIAISE
jgi:hypothetical protein